MTRLQSNRRSMGPGPAAWALIGALLGLAVIATIALGAWRLGVSAADDGTQGWTSLATLITTLGAVLVLAVGALITWAVLRAQRGVTRVDAAAKYLGNKNKRDLQDLSIDAARQTAERLGCASNGPGVPIGRAVRHKDLDLYSTWEQVRIALMGPRAGKTSAVCVRELVETKGPAIATSNKRDLLDLTRGPRSELGQVRVHDPQNVAGEEPTWYWDPLSYTTTVDRADEMADVFVAASTSADARTDYFTLAGKKTLSAMLLAASVGGERISIILEWLSNPARTGPVQHLATAGFMEVATALQGQIRLTPKQRDGVFGTALEWVGFLRNKDVLRWAEKDGPGDRRPHFDPTSFATSTDTLYLISKEGAGTARALTGALTMAVLDAADKVGARSRGMRLPKPMCAVLDEAANVTRLRQLPDLFSFYGSRGIILSVFLQSWAQGVEAWGENGMKKMWSAANIRLVGAGLAEGDFINSVNTLIGGADVLQRATTTSRGSKSISNNPTRQEILSASEISEMPQWRALLFSSGNRAALVELIPWWKMPYAEAVTASKDHFEGQAITERANA